MTYVAPSAPSIEAIIDIWRRLDALERELAFMKTPKPDPQAPKVDA